MRPVGDGRVKTGDIQDRQQLTLRIQDRRARAAQADVPSTKVLSSVHGHGPQFIGRLRDECLNETLFSSLSEARTVLASWQADYNGMRPHSGLANKTPWEFRTEHVAVAANPTNAQDFNPGLYL